MSDRFTQDWMSNEWQDFAYQKIKENNFNTLDSYLKFQPMTILDIGCGLAWESRMFNVKYNTTLYLIDGDASNNQTKDAKSKDVNYHQSADTFLYYNSFCRLDDELKKLGTKDYTLIDCNNLTLPDIKFDLITSWLSCGFHYPVSTYASLIKKHSHSGTRIIVDLRKNKKTGEIFLEECFKIIQIVSEAKKSVTAEIELLG
jgi:SAM-dependent methyltransferase